MSIEQFFTISGSVLGSSLAVALINYYFLGGKRKAGTENEKGKMDIAKVSIDIATSTINQLTTAVERGQKLLEKCEEDRQRMIEERKNYNAVTGEHTL